MRSSCVQVWPKSSRQTCSLPLSPSRRQCPLADPHQCCHVVSALRPLQLSSIPRDKSLDATEMVSGSKPMHTDPSLLLTLPPQSVSGGGREGSKILTDNPATAWKHSSINLAAEECDGHTHRDCRPQTMPHLSNPRLDSSPSILVDPK